jgi:transcriptional regulator with XRE-family HTH domain
MSTSDHNPFRELRTRQGISQYELARRAGISKHAILRLEQGCYAEPLPSVLEYFLKYFDIPQYKLLEQYREFQYNIRFSNALLLGDSLTERLLSCPVGLHPLTYLREGVGLNPTQLAKALCISQSTIVYFEKSSIHQKTVPNQLMGALHDAEYTMEDTDSLVLRYHEYRKWLTASKELTLVK